MLRLVLLLLYLLGPPSTLPQTTQGGGADPLGGSQSALPPHSETDGGGGADPLG